VHYPAKIQANAANEYEALMAKNEAPILRSLIDDYGVMRAGARECEKQKLNLESTK
jgi:hypothetical protein